MVYSLWLVPPSGSQISASISKIIQSLGCSFAPHVTIVSKIPLSSSIDDIRTILVNYFQNQSKPTVHIQTLATGSAFYKRVFLRCEKTESLVSLARFSKEKFVDDKEDINKWVDEYDPHISLVYGDEKDCSNQEFLKRIDASPFIDQTWQGGRILLVDTSRELSQWKTVLDFSIS
mgnify:CR=1 FL=1